MPVEGCMVLCQGGVLVPGRRGAATHVVGEDVDFVHSTFAGERTDVFGTDAMDAESVYLPMSGDRAHLVCKTKTVTVTYTGRGVKSAGGAPSQVEVSREITVSPGECLTAKEISTRLISLQVNSRADATSLRHYLLRATPPAPAAHAPAARSPSYFITDTASPLVTWLSLCYNEVSDGDRFLLRTAAGVRDKRVTVNDLWGNSVRLSVPACPFSTMTYGVSEAALHRSGVLEVSHSALKAVRQGGAPEGPEEVAEVDEALRIANLLPGLGYRLQRIDTKGVVGEKRKQRKEERQRRKRKQHRRPRIIDSDGNDSSSSASSVSHPVSITTPSPDTVGDDLSVLTFSSVPEGASEYRVLYQPLSVVVYYAGKPVLRFDVTQTSTHEANLVKILEELSAKGTVDESDIAASAGEGGGNSGSGNGSITPLSEKYVLLARDGSELMLVHGSRLAGLCKAVQLVLRQGATISKSAVCPEDAPRLLPKLFLRRIYVSVHSEESTRSVRIGCCIPSETTLQKDTEVVLAEVKEEALRIFGITGVGRGAYELTGPSHIQDGSAYCLCRSKSSGKVSRNPKPSLRSGSGRDEVPLPKFVTLQLDGVSHVCEVYPSHDPRTIQGTLRAAVGLSAWSEVSVKCPDIDPASITFASLPAVLVLHTKAPPNA